MPDVASLCRFAAESAMSSALGASALGTLFTVSGPAAPIVLPIFAAVVLARWVYDVYKQSRDVLRRLMAYIVDLILFVQLLFSVVAINNRPISRRLIKIVFAAYNDSIAKTQVHSDIREHVARAGVFSGNRDSTLNKIIELIKQHHEGTDEMIRQKDQILAFEYPEMDEQWDVPTSTR
jgi:predicted PurR-regulated permease PerM